MNPFLLNEERIAISGASSGIGAAIAQAAALAGSSVLLLGRNEERLAATKRSLHGSGHLMVSGDLNSDDKRWLTEALASFGSLTGMVHAAGMQVVEPLRFAKNETFAKTISLNVKAGFDFLKICRSPKIRKAGRSFSAVFISSTAAHGAAPGLAAYSASKGAIESAARAWAVELAKENVRVNSVAPGYVSGEMLEGFRRTATASAAAAMEGRYPLGFGTPEDVAMAVQYLLSPAARWITGTVLTVDGGFSAT